MLCPSMVPIVGADSPLPSFTRGFSFAEMRIASLRYVMAASINRRDNGDVSHSALCVRPSYELRGSDKNHRIRRNAFGDFAPIARIADFSATSIWSAMANHGEIENSQTLTTIWGG